MASDDTTRTTTRTHEIGAIEWADLTVPDADGVRDFYRDVVGYEVQGFDMGGYEDYCMQSPGAGSTHVGICHARGANADLPAQWLVYINVEDLDRSVEACRSGGGEILAGPKSMDGGRYCVIRDPSGAVCALFQHPPAAGDG